MILFLGDSFTWGQGLHYYYLVENEGWTWDDCRKFLNDVNRFESLGFNADEFRKQNHFPYLVGKELNLPVVTPRAENGGDNYEIYKAINNRNIFLSDTSIDFIVIQFSAPTRSLISDNSDNFSSVDEYMEYTIDRVAEILNRNNFKWFGISWFEEMGEILEKKYSENHVPIIYKGKKYKSFDFQKNMILQDLTIQHTQYIDDGHFNLEGHQVIADSIITKLKGN